MGANIAESEAAQSRSDFVHELSIASKEARKQFTSCSFWIKVN
ncbi:four helix bundle protein [Psychroflexus salinarum]|uniref:Four helix bundle protein n=1 Tax=Psychroflexus salinarum TaxID=546024 RepID=A0ABW3GPX0_9FLAO